MRTHALARRRHDDPSGSVALLEDGTLLGEACVESAATHSARLLRSIDFLHGAQGRDVKAVDASPWPPAPAVHGHPHRRGKLLVDHEGRPLRLVFERLVPAAGARELFLPFPGWTLPGVVGVGGAQALLKAGARFAGLRVVVAGSGPLLPAVAAALKRQGARIVGIAEQAPLARLAAFGASLWREPGKLAEGLGLAATLAGVGFRAGAWVRDVHEDRGSLCDVAQRRPQQLDLEL